MIGTIWKGCDVEMTGAVDFNPDSLRYNEAGLIPAIAQCAETGDVLMMAWMNRASIEKTLQTGKVTYWSRSRAAFWVKGKLGPCAGLGPDRAWIATVVAFLVVIRQTGFHLPHQSPRLFLPPSVMVQRSIDAARNDYHLWIGRVFAPPRYRSNRAHLPLGQTFAMYHGSTLDGGNAAQDSRADVQNHVDGGGIEQIFTANDAADPLCSMSGHHTQIVKISSYIRPVPTPGVADTGQRIIPRHRVLTCMARPRFGEMRWRQACQTRAALSGLAPLGAQRYRSQCGATGAG